MPAARYSAADVLAMNLEKIQLEHDGLYYIVPESIEDYQHKFPGLPPDVYPLLAHPNLSTPSETGSDVQLDRRG